MVVLGVETDAAQSILTYSNGMAEVANTVTLQAVGTDGVYKTTGGDYFTITIEQLCNPSTIFDCNLDAAQDSVAGLPISMVMTDNGDGTYAASYTISASSGTISVGVILMSGPGIQADYYNNYYWTSPVYATQYETQMEIYWYSGYVGPLPSTDWMTASFSGTIQAPETGLYSFYFEPDDYGVFTINGVTETGNYWGDYLSVTLTVDVVYPFTFDYREDSGQAEIKFRWRKPSDTSYSVVPASAFLEQARVGGTVYTVEIDPTTVPAVSTIESAPSTATAGTTITVSIRSRQSDSSVNYDAIGDDSYSVILIDSAGSPSLSVTAA